MGMLLYGYAWTLSYIPEEEFVESVRYGAVIRYDQKAQLPYYNYIDEERRQHVV